MQLKEHNFTAEDLLEVKTFAGQHWQWWIEHNFDKHIKITDIFTQHKDILSLSEQFKVSPCDWHISSAPTENFTHPKVTCSLR